jgi:DNA-binding transcriptional ArsR family regulator
MEDQLSAVFGALADPTRRAILARLAEGDANVAELAAPFAMSQPAVSRHLKVLERAGLITRTRRGTARINHLEADPLRDATAWLARYRAYWVESHERLDELLAALRAAPPAPVDPALPADPPDATEAPDAAGPPETTEPPAAPDTGAPLEGTTP